MMPMFARDSVGTPRDEISERIASEFRLIAGGADAAAAAGWSNLLQLEAVALDVSRMAQQKWWHVGENGRLVLHRLGMLTRMLYQESASGGRPVVLVAHSRIIRTLFQLHTSDEHSARLSKFSTNLVSNCAIIRVTLRGAEEGSGEPPCIVDASLLFGAGFQ